MVPGRFGIRCCPGTLNARKVQVFLLCVGASVKNRQRYLRKTDVWHPLSDPGEVIGVQAVRARGFLAISLSERSVGPRSRAVWAG